MYFKSSNPVYSFGFAEFIPNITSTYMYTIGPQSLSSCICKLQNWDANIKIKCNFILKRLWPHCDNIVSYNIIPPTVFSTDKQAVFEYYKTKIWLYNCEISVIGQNCNSCEIKVLCTKLKYNFIKGFGHIVII